MVATNLQLPVGQPFDILRTLMARWIVARRWQFDAPDSARPSQVLPSLFVRIKTATRSDAGNPGRWGLTI
jgi:hypothetical protein